MAGKEGTVVFVNHNAGSPRHGPNLRTYYAAKYLAARGYSVHIFSSSYSHKYVYLPEISGEVTDQAIDGIHYHWVRTRKYEGTFGRMWSFHQFGTKLPSIVTRRVTGMKALICSSPPPVFVRICDRIARRYNARLLFDVRDLWPLTILEMGAASRYNPYVTYMGWLERYAYRNADMVVSALPGSESYMRGKGLPEGQFVCIENGTEALAVPKIDESEIPGKVREVLYARKEPARCSHTSFRPRSLAGAVLRFC